MRLIDLDALGIGKCNPDVFNDKGYAKGWNSAIEILQNAPTLDAMAVVRCKDCRYSREPNRHDRDENAACEGVLICCVGFDHVYPSAYDGLIFMGEDDYCSKGERREEVSE